MPDPSNPLTDRAAAASSVALSTVAAPLVCPGQVMRSAAITADLSASQADFGSGPSKGPRPEPGAAVVQPASPAVARPVNTRLANEMTDVS